MAYIQKKYSELDAWIPTLTPGTYDLEVDCTGVPFDAFNARRVHIQSEVAVKLSAAKDGVYFNIKLINISPSIKESTCLFYNLPCIKSIDTKSFINFTNLTAFADSCVNLSFLDTSNFINATDILGFVSNCPKLSSIDCSAFTQVLGAAYAFENCTSLTSITGMEAFTKVTDASNMFSGCSSLTTLVLTSQLARATERTYSMYSNCTALKTIKCIGDGPSIREELRAHESYTNFPDAQITSWLERRKKEKPPIMTINGDVEIKGNKVASYSRPGWYIENWGLAPKTSERVTINLGSPGTYILTIMSSSDWSENIQSLIEVYWIDKRGIQRNIYERGTMEAGGGTSICTPIETKEGTIDISISNNSGDIRTYAIRATWLKLGDL